MHTGCILTLVDAVIEGDALFSGNQTGIIGNLFGKKPHQADAENQYPYTFTLYERVRS